MASDRIVSALQFAHVFSNGALFLALAYQGRLGWRIRNTRVTGVLQDFSVAKRHRALGSVLATLLPVGYLTGLTTAYIHKGLWLRYPGHLAVGTVLLAIVFSVVLTSRGIRGIQSPWRTPHFALGLLLLSSFLVQIYLGLNILR
jgi:hypothetical protein